MEVYNKSKTKILTSYDLEKGYLRDDILEIPIDEVKEIKEKSHLEPLKEYPHCYRKVIDVRGVKYSPAHTENKPIQVYVPYTKKELEKLDSKKQIDLLKDWFDKKYSYYVEKLTRFQALQIEESIQDDFRSKTYSNLNELYLEAEVVRAEINYLEESL